jgi:hypothetical protein
LLLEPQRSNLVTNSERFTSWISAGGTVTSNTATSPDGYQNADTLTGARYQTGFASNQYTVSCFAKKVDGDGKFVIRLDAPTAQSAQFNLNNGTIDSVAAGYSATITSYGNSWYRCTITTPVTTTITNLVLLSASASAASTYVWGAQCEAGAYATSYIPTLAASATRGADAASKTGISSLIGQTEGTLFYEFSVPVNENITRAIVVSGATTDNRVSVATFAGSLFARVDVGGVNQVNSSAAITVTNMNKVAFRYKANDFAVYVNGVKVITDTSGSTFTAGTLDRFAFIQPDATSPFNGIVSQMAFFTTGLTDAELATLTTL